METTLFGVKGLALRKITRNEGETNGQADEKWHGNGCGLSRILAEILLMSMYRKPPKTLNPRP